jgi:hypothetical protein
MASDSTRVINILGTPCEVSNKGTTIKGIKFVYLTKNGKSQYKAGSHIFFKNLNKGSQYYDSETKRLNSGQAGCSSPPKEAVDAFNRMRRDCARETGVAKIQNLGSLTCWKASYIFNRAAPGSTTLNECKNSPNKASNRSCTSIHGVGRAMDILNELVGAISDTNMVFDTNDSFTANSPAYKVWLWFASNAHKYNIAGLSNEWWHWQYFGPISDDPGSKNNKSNSSSNNKSNDKSNDNLSKISNDIKDNNNSKNTSTPSNDLDPNLFKQNTDMPKISEKSGKAANFDANKLKINSISESTIKRDELTLTKYEYDK